MVHEVFCRLALVDKEVLHCELLVLAPTQSQALLACPRVACGIQQVIDSFTVYLQEGEGDHKGTALGGGHLFEQPPEQHGDDALCLSLQ
jgi:hypothetical protein